MLKVRTKFRLVLALYMMLPMVIMILFTRDTPVFMDDTFQNALGISVAVIIFLTFCSPFLLGLKWMFLSQLQQVEAACSDIKNGRYTFFSLPNEPAEIRDENEMLRLLRNMNWMIRPIESREAELETRVEKRTRELIRARDEAKASARAKSEFLATMSHEIRTPMNAITGMSDLLLQADLDSRQKEHAAIIHTASRSLLTIINDILDFSKIDSGKLTLEAIPVHLRELLEETADMFKHQAAEKAVEFVLDIAPDVPVTVMADPLRLRQVLINLIANAVKFTRKGEICVCLFCRETARARARLFFSVRDTGVGMSAGTVDRLFTPFTQADSSTTREFGGTGLGLAISRKLVELMGGRIRVDSRPGKGSCFRFDLTADICTRADTGADGNEAVPAGGPMEISPEIPAMAGELETLIRQNSLKAKHVCKAFSEKLQSSAVAGDARTLESQIKRFDFPAAAKTLQKLQDGIRSRPA